MKNDVPPRESRESDGEAAVCKSYLDTSVKSERQTIHDAQVKKRDRRITAAVKKLL